MLKSVFESKFNTPPPPQSSEQFVTLLPPDFEHILQISLFKFRVANNENENENEDEDEVEDKDEDEVEDEDEDEDGKPGFDINDCPVKTRIRLLRWLLFETAAAATAEKFRVINFRFIFSSLQKHQANFFLNKYQ